MPTYNFFFLAWFFLEFKLVYICDILSAYRKLRSKIFKGEMPLWKNTTTQF